MIAVQGMTIGFRHASPGAVGFFVIVAWFDTEILTTYWAGFYLVLRIEI
jgi:hypothetical protein